MSISRTRYLRSFGLPIFATIVVPSILLAFIPGGFSGFLVMRFILGMILMSVGFALLVICISLFSIVGDGTLTPWDPPQNLVLQGPYCYTRNPMLAGVCFIIFGQAAIFDSWALLAWGAFFVALNTVYFALSEEPGLEKRFGEDYKEYKRSVPRWIPRLTPWTNNTRSGRITDVQI